MKNTLHNNPYKVPDGYFDGLKSRLYEIPAGFGKVSVWGRVKPYLALAAAFAALVVGGNALLKGTIGSQDVELSDYERYRYSDLIPVASGYYLEDEPEEEVPTESDITDYLIDTQFEVEHINDYENEGLY